MDGLRVELQEIFREVFDDDELEIMEEMTANDIDGWDSLMHINLIIAVEKHYGIKFATAEISGLKAEGQNIGSFMELISSKLK